MSQYLTPNDACCKCGFVVGIREVCAEYNGRIAHDSCLTDAERNTEFVDYTVNERIIMEATHARINHGAFAFNSMFFAEVYLSAPVLGDWQMWTEPPTLPGYMQERAA